MAVAKGGVRVPIVTTVDTKDLEKMTSQLNRLKAQVNKQASGFNNLGKAMKGAFAIGAIAAVGAKALAEARDAYRVSQLTATIVKNTGAAAFTSVAQIDALANSISNLTGIDDELVQAGSNVLLSFGNIRNAGTGAAAVFDRATAAAVDLGAAMGKDPAAAAKLLGKALNDPVKGVTALRRAGVTLTNEQTAQIKAMQAQGNLLGAQQVILQSVEGRFKGAAAAMADPITKLQTILNNLLETVGTPILGALEPLLTALQPLFAELTPILAQLGASLAPIVQDLGVALVAGVKMAMPILDALLPTLSSLAQLLAALTPIFTLLIPLFRMTSNVLSTTLLMTIRTLTAVIYGLVKAFEATILVLSRIPGIGRQFKGALAPIRAVTASLHDIINSPLKNEVAAPIVAAAGQYSASAAQLQAGAAATVAAGKDFAKAAKVKTPKAKARAPRTGSKAPRTVASTGSYVVAASGGGLSLSVTVNGSVVQEKDIARTIRNELIQFGKRVGNPVALGV